MRHALGLQKERYCNLAREADNEHRRRHPGYKYNPTKAREDLERDRMTQGLVVKGKVERLKIERDAIRRLRKQFEACASAQADLLHPIPADTNIKYRTLWRGRPFPK
jgi:hypothetical protein